VHIRQSIRNAVAIIVTGLGATVYKSAIYQQSLNTLPSIRVSTPDDTGEQLTIHDGTPFRTITVLCEAVVAASDGYDDALDVLCEKIETAILANTTLTGTVINTSYEGTEITLGHGDKPMASAMVRFLAYSRS